MNKILIVGSTKNKNIELIYSIAAESKDLQFILVGNYMNNLNLDNFVQYQNISEKSLINLYKSSNILLFPTLSEGFGLPIVEAQHFGLPVITSKFEPMRSVAGKRSALFINPRSKEEIKNAIYLILKNNSIRKTLIKNGLKNVERFRFDLILSKHEECYRNISLLND
mgnify:FL=1|jgi:glycosyltransferase involved in cell wall biosynthesis